MPRICLIGNVLCSPAQKQPNDDDDDDDDDDGIIITDSIYMANNSSL